MQFDLDLCLNVLIGFTQNSLQIAHTLEQFQVNDPHNECDIQLFYWCHETNHVSRLTD